MYMQGLMPNLMHILLVAYFNHNLLAKIRVFKKVTTDFSFPQKINLSFSVP